ncbi:hypothetical protein RHIZ_04540 [Rhizobium skierniewicense]|uniref:hypothetical protein n=1 Tax=Rhizobium TaxID=379 RepID=UPI001FADB65E|nr:MULTISPECIES: hypothetical protein [Rhizobium]MCI9865208.1 hypothetical protein [Rhizobium skierniewicense]
MAKVETLPQKRSDFSGPNPSPSGRGIPLKECRRQFSRTCLRYATAPPPGGLKDRSVRAIAGAGQMQRVPVYRLTFASST